MKYSWHCILLKTTENIDFFYFNRKGGLLLNNVVGILGALAMGASKVSELYELLIMGRYLIGVNCGKY